MIAAISSGRVACIRPVGKKTIAEIFVNHSVLIFDDLITTENPRAEKNIQVLALDVATEGRKAADVRDEKPTGNTSRSLATFVA